MPEPFQVPPITTCKVAGSRTGRVKDMARLIPGTLALQETGNAIEAAALTPVLLTAAVAITVAGVVAAVAALTPVITRRATAAPVIAGSSLPAQGDDEARPSANPDRPRRRP